MAGKPPGGNEEYGNLAVGERGCSMTVIVGPWQNSTQVRMSKDSRQYVQRTAIIQSYPYDVSIQDLPLSVRSYSCLVYKNVRTVGDLVTKKRSDLLRVRNFGRKSLHEIEEILDGLGLALAKERWGLEERGGAE